MRLPLALCHDQECIDPAAWPLKNHWWHFDNKWYKSPVYYPWFKNRTDQPYQLYNHVILVHSETNSQIISKSAEYGYVPVHWLCHAVISQDWYRFAEHDPSLAIDTANPPYQFLIYNRAWSGSREYRLKFAEMLVQSGLIDSCLTSLAMKENDLHWSQYRCSNPVWQTQLDIGKFFQPNESLSSASADYQQDDYNRTAIEVVLETWFDDQKNHLTEKTFRPIAVGQPFILASTPRSLQYLRSYGFETFCPWIDESYDLVDDAMARLQAITREMLRLQSMPQMEFEKVRQNCRNIALRNKQRFFSNEFFQQVIAELRDGMTHAIAQCKQGVSTHNWDLWADQQTDPPDVSHIARDLGLI